MSFLSSILNLFGTKSQRDMKELSPSLKKCKDFEESMAILTNDELREKTKSFKNKISQSVNELDIEILELKSKIEIEQSSKVQEELFNKIESKKTEKSKKISDTLNLIKEEAFAVIKETAAFFESCKHIRFFRVLDLMSGTSPLSIKSFPLCFFTSLQSTWIA